MRFIHGGRWRMSVPAVFLMCVSCFLYGAPAAPVATSEAVKAQITVEPINGIPETFIRGADISMLAQIEQCGGKYYDAQGKEGDLFAIMKANGVNWARFRVWNNPVNPADVSSNGKIISRAGEPSGGGNNDLARTIALAKRAKAAGLKILIDFHYSDTWTDPGKQGKPAAWKKLSGDELCKALENFTKDSIRAMIDAGARPDMVQIGNELNAGMLWPDGKIWKGENDGEVGGMSGFIRLLKSASKGVRAGEKGGEKIKIVIHLANGGDNGLYRSIFDPVTAENVDFDVIGFSFYPYWHGSLDDLIANMNYCAMRYGKDAIVAETAYAYTESDADSQGNVFQLYSDDKYGYLPTVQGQATWMRDLMATVNRVMGGRGLGVFYWEPDWIPVEGAGWRTGEGNNWDNQAMFDPKGYALPSLAVFNLAYGRGEVANAFGGSAKIAAAGSIVAKSFEPVRLKTSPGKAPELPKNVKVIYSGDSELAEPVKWDAHDWSAEIAGNEVTLKGLTVKTSFPVSAHVAVTSRVNIVADPSFESGQLGEWTLNGPGKACFVENNKTNAHSGKWSYKYWLDTAFRSTLTRTFKNIPNGTYSFSLWAMGGGGEKSAKIFVTDFGSGKTKSVAVKNTGWKNWNQYTISGIEVTNNQLTVGVYLDTNPGNWGNFDDAEIYKD